MATLDKQMREAGGKATPGRWMHDGPRYGSPAIADSKYIALHNPENMGKILDVVEAARELSRSWPRFDAKLTEESERFMLNRRCDLAAAIWELVER